MDYSDIDEEFRDFVSDDEGDTFVEPAFENDWSAVIVVDNLPKIPVTKYDKLIGVLKRIFDQTGTITRMVMPSEADKTLGFAYVEFASAEEATKAIRLTDGYSLDKSHVFKVNPYTDLAKLEDLAEVWSAPAQPEFVPRLNPHSWLGDAAHRDQFVLRYNNETEIHWAERAQQPTIEYGGEREKEGGLYWCEQYTQWSPAGSLLATFHNKGIALWGDASFSKQGRFAHLGVKSLIFSPNENYMITANDQPGDTRSTVVWELRSRKEMRSFAVEMLAVPRAIGVSGAEEDERAPQFEAARFSWSHDDSYVARRGKDKVGSDVITVYELPSMLLMGKKSLKAEGVRDFQWSPKANVMAYWAPEQGNTPARVTLVSIPSRKELRQKNLVNVSDCTIHWHPEGTYLCVKVLRHTKSRKTIYNSFELFRVNEPLVPVEMMEVKDTVHCFAWEPSGHRFAVVHGEGSKPSVSFYSMLSLDGKKQELTLITTLENRACNTLVWSPMGNHIVLAGLGDSYNGVLEFYDVDMKWSKSTEHYRCTNVEWDPSGRIVSTAVAQPLEGAFFKFQMDNGYKLWTFQGGLFFETAYENFYQLAWRPRPKSLLDATQKKSIVKNLRKYERRFAHDDRSKDHARQQELTKGKRQLRRDYRALLLRRADTYRATAQHRKDMRNGVDADDDANYMVTTHTVESVLSTKEEIVPSQ